MFSSMKSTWLSVVIVLGLAFLLGLAQPVSAQKDQGSQGDGQSETRNQGTSEITPEMTRQKMVQRYKSLQEDLAKIQQQAMEDNEDLKQEQQDLQSMIRESMESNMAAEDVDVERLQELQAKLQGQGQGQGQELAQDEKQSLEKEYKEQVNAYQRARAKTARDKEVQQKQEAFREDMLAAMKKVDPETEKIIQELQGIQHQMQYIKQSAPEN